MLVFSVLIDKNWFAVLRWIKSLLHGPFFSEKLHFVCRKFAWKVYPPPCDISHVEGWRAGSHINEQNAPSSLWSSAFSVYGVIFSP